MKCIVLAATALALALGVGPAFAQLPILSTADQKAILCISDNFSEEDITAVAQAEINGDAKAVAAESMAMVKAGAACKDLLRGDQRRIGLAESVAIEEAIIDVAVSQLKADGMTTAKGSLYDIWSALSPADQAYFLDAKAPEDAAFRARLRPLLFKAGVPNNESDIDGGMLVMECISNVAVYYRRWLDLQGAAPAPAN